MVHLLIISGLTRQQLNWSPFLLSYLSPKATKRMNFYKYHAIRSRSKPIDDGPSPSAKNGNFCDFQGPFYLALPPHTLALCSSYAKLPPVP